MRNREIAAHGGCNLFLRPKSKERATNTAFRWGYGVDSKHRECSHSRQKCLLGTSQTLIRKEARYHDGKPKTKYPGEVLCDRRGKGTDGTEDGPAPDKADRRLPAEDGD